jgi:hypothetical protein
VLQLDRLFAHQGDSPAGLVTGRFEDAARHEQVREQRLDVGVAVDHQVGGPLGPISVISTVRIAAMMPVRGLVAPLAY